MANTKSKFLAFSAPTPKELADIMNKELIGEAILQIHYSVCESATIVNDYKVNRHHTFSVLVVVKEKE